METKYLTIETTQGPTGATRTSVIATTPDKLSNRFVQADTCDGRRTVEPGDEVRNSVRLQAFMDSTDQSVDFTLCLTADEAFNLAARLVESARRGMEAN